MSTKPNKGGAQSLGLPGLPTLPGLPGLPQLPGLALPPELPSLKPTAKVVNPLDKNEALYDDHNVEDSTALDTAVIVDEFTAIREGRAKQAESIELANDTEFWFAVAFQTREQKEVFLQAMKWFEHGDKYLDGRFVAATQGIVLPKRPAPYKVGRLDAKLKELT